MVRFSSSLVLPILLILLNSIYFTCASSCAPVTPATAPTAPPPPKSPVAPVKCSRDALKLSVCAEMLVNGVVGTPQHQCCTLLQGLAGFDAAVCLCTAIEAGVLGFNINVAVDFSMLINTCRKGDASGFKCTS